MYMSYVVFSIVLNKHNFRLCITSLMQTLYINIPGFVPRYFLKCIGSQ